MKISEEQELRLRDAKTHLEDALVFANMALGKLEAGDNLEADKLFSAAAYCAQTVYLIGHSMANERHINEIREDLKNG